MEGLAAFREGEGSESAEYLQQKKRCREGRIIIGDAPCCVQMTGGPLVSWRLFQFPHEGALGAKGRNMDAMLMKRAAADG